MRIYEYSIEVGYVRVSLSQRGSVEVCFCFVQHNIAAFSEPQSHWS